MQDHVFVPGDAAVVHKGCHFVYRPGALFGHRIDAPSDRLRYRKVSSDE